MLHCILAAAGFAALATTGIAQGQANATPTGSSVSATACGQINSCGVRPAVTATITTFSIGASGIGTWDVIVSGVPREPNFGVLIYGTPGIVAPIPTIYGGLCISPFFRALGTGSFPFPTTGACATPLAMYRFDFGSYIAATSGTLGILPGNMIGLQAWYRDPPSTGTANLSDVIGPFGPLVP